MKTMAAGGGDLPEGLETTFTFVFATISMVSVGLQMLVQTVNKDAEEVALSGQPCLRPIHGLCHNDH